MKAVQHTASLGLELWHNGSSHHKQCQHVTWVLVFSLRSSLSVNRLEKAVEDGQNPDFRLALPWLLQPSRK